MFKRICAVSLVSFTLIMAAGCGGRNDGVGVDTGDTGEITEPTIPTTPTDPVATPTPAPQIQPVSATVSTKDKTGGFLFWFKKMSAEIAVTNPNAVQVSAKLTITFSKGGSSVETQEQTVDLGPGENKTVEVKSTKTADDVSVYATMNTPAGGTGSDPGAAYPTGGATTGGTTGSGSLPY